MNSIPLSNSIFKAEIFPPLVGEKPGGKIVVHVETAIGIRSESKEWPWEGRFDDEKFSEFADWFHPTFSPYPSRVEFLEKVRALFELLENVNVNTIDMCETPAPSDEIPNESSAQRNSLFYEHGSAES